MINLLLQLKQQEIISNGDYYFAKLIDDNQKALNYDEKTKNLAVLLAGLCHNALMQGHSCVLFSDISYFGLDLNKDIELSKKLEELLPTLDPQQWQSYLQDHIAFSTEPEQKIAPLVFDYQRLYFYRVWQDEKDVADYLLASLSQDNFLAGAKTGGERSESFLALKQILTDLFPETEVSNKINWQKIAVATALEKPFCLIAGGPGTGKTTSVVKLLAAWQQHCIAQQRAPLQIALAAPTGKAAARLTESISGALNHLAIAPEIRDLIPTDAKTLHRLLGVKRFDDRLTYHAKNPLPIDLLVLDESSMVDLAMMAKLLRALKKDCRLILLGDKDQLASVESGAILSELGQFFQQPNSLQFADYLWLTTEQKVDAKNGVDPIRDSLVRLVESHRFNDQSGIGYLARAINEKQAKQSWALLQGKTEPSYSDIQLIEFNDNQTGGQNWASFQQQCLSQVVAQAVEQYADYLSLLKQRLEFIFTEQNGNLVWQQNELQQIFAKFNQVRFLTATRSGTLGVEKLNQSIAEGLQRKGLVQFRHHRDWYLGKPIMVTENDPTVGLYNGDIGLYLGNGKVAFEIGNTYKVISISRVPNYEPAFAMTVHKSQGSEFEHTFFVLPLQANPILGKELVYTAVTRAKKKLTVFASQKIWMMAVNVEMKRHSGLALRLQQKL